MSMFVGFFSMGERAQSVTSRSLGTVKISSGTRVGLSAAAAGAAAGVSR